jgi:hypothetical protein
MTKPDTWGNRLRFYRFALVKQALLPLRQEIEKNKV